jgi:hypothetical protein
VINVTFYYILVISWRSILLVMYMFNFHCLFSMFVVSVVSPSVRVRRGRDRMVVGLTTTYAISA